MKQHINLNQLNSLSEKAKERLREWLFNSGYSTPMDNNTVQTTPLITPSIGQMIEFLDEHIHLRFSGIKRLYTDQWDVDISEPVDISDGELCDALFEAVKEELEKE